MLTADLAELYRGGPDWQRELEQATAHHGLMESLLGEPHIGAGMHKPPRKTLLPFPSPMMQAGGGAAAFTFGYDGAPVLTNEDWGGFPNLSLGNVKTADAGTSGIATKLWLRSGTSGITFDVRIIIYATISTQNWSNAPLTSGVIAGGVAASSTAFVTVAPFTIVPGQEYALSVQASNGPVNFASVGSLLQNWWYVRSYAAGPMNPGPNPVNNNGFNRAPAVWCSN
jgi:hypothetical protein